MLFLPKKILNSRVCRGVAPVTTLFIGESDVSSTHHRIIESKINNQPSAVWIWGAKVFGDSFLGDKMNFVRLCTDWDLIKFDGSPDAKNQTTINRRYVDWEVKYHRIMVWDCAAVSFSCVTSYFFDNREKSQHNNQPNSRVMIFE